MNPILEIREMLEEKIERLTTEVVKLREAIEKNGVGGGKASGGEAASSGDKAASGKGKPGAGAKKSKHTADAVKAAVIKVKDDVSKEEAQRIIKEVGGAAALADLLTKTDKFDAVMEACEAAMNADDDGDDDDDL